MGFIPQIATKTLYAYLTPLGRQYILDGDKADFQVEYFTLHDDDVNYFISSNMSAGTSSYYTLPSGFVPDITGDADTCIKSIAEGTNINIMSSLSGSTIIDTTTNKLTVGRIGTDGVINSRVCTLSIPNAVAYSFPNSSKSNGIAPTLNVQVSQPATDNTPVTTDELLNTKFYITITNIVNASSFIINGIQTTSLLIPSIGSAITTYTITFTPIDTTISNSFDINIVPYRSFIDLIAPTTVTYKTV